MPLTPIGSWLDYHNLDYLIQVEDRSRAERIGSRLRSVGIPACVQTVTVRTEATRPTYIYRFYVPTEQIDMAWRVVTERPILESGDTYISGSVRDAAVGSVDLGGTPGMDGSPPQHASDEHG